MLARLWRSILPARRLAGSGSCSFRKDLEPLEILLRSPGGRIPVFADSFESLVSGGSVSGQNGEVGKAVQLAAGLKAKCPHWYVVLQSVARTQGWEKAHVRALFEKAVSFEPDYYHYYREYALYLLPKWYGEEGEAEAFAEEVSTRVGGKQGGFKARGQSYAYKVTGEGWRLLGERLQLASGALYPQPKYACARATRAVTESGFTVAQCFSVSMWAAHSASVARSPPNGPSNPS